MIEMLTINDQPTSLPHNSAEKYLESQIRLIPPRCVQEVKKFIENNQASFCKGMNFFYTNQKYNRVYLVRIFNKAHKKANHFHQKPSITDAELLELLIRITYFWILIKRKGQKLNSVTWELFLREENIDYKLLYDKIKQEKFMSLVRNNFKNSGAPSVSKEQIEFLIEKLKSLSMKCQSQKLQNLVLDFIKDIQDLNEGLTFKSLIKKLLKPKKIKTKSREMILKMNCRLSKLRIYLDKKVNQKNQNPLIELVQDLQKTATYTQRDADCLEMFCKLATIDPNQLKFDQQARNNSRIFIKGQQIKLQLQSNLKIQIENQSESDEQYCNYICHAGEEYDQYQRPSPKELQSTYPYYCALQLKVKFPGYKADEWSTGYATQLAPRILVTCGHCAYEKGQYAEKILVLCEGKQFQALIVEANKNFQQNGRYHPQYDIALILLKDEIRRTAYLPIAKNFKDADKFYLIKKKGSKGYLDVIHGLKIHQHKRAQYQNVQVFRGLSGSPILCRLNELNIFYNIGFHTSGNQEQKIGQSIYFNDNITNQILEFERRHIREQKQSRISLNIIDFNTLWKRFEFKEKVPLTYSSQILSADNRSIQTNVSISKNYQKQLFQKNCDLVELALKVRQLNYNLSDCLVLLDGFRKKVEAKHNAYKKNFKFKHLQISTLFLAIITQLFSIADILQKDKLNKVQIKKHFTKIVRLAQSQKLQHFLDEKVLLEREQSNLQEHYRQEIGYQRAMIKFLCWNIFHSYPRVCLPVEQLYWDHPKILPTIVRNIEQTMSTMDISQYDWYRYYAQPYIELSNWIAEDLSKIVKKDESSNKVNFEVMVPYEALTVVGTNDFNHRDQIRLEIDSKYTEQIQQKYTFYFYFSLRTQCEIEVILSSIQNQRINPHSSMNFCINLFVTSTLKVQDQPIVSIYRSNPQHFKDLFMTIVNCFCYMHQNQESVACPIEMCMFIDPTQLQAEFFFLGSNKLLFQKIKSFKGQRNELAEYYPIQEIKHASNEVARWLAIDVWMLGKSLQRMFTRAKFSEQQIATHFPQKQMILSLMMEKYGQRIGVMELKERIKQLWF